MKKYVTKGLIVVGLASALTVGVFIGEAVAYQSHMEAALGYLQSARAELAVAERNKAGHRAEALRLVNAAIAETRAGIAAAE